MPGRGKGKCLFLESHLKEFRFISTEKSLFLCKRLLSTAEGHFFGGGVFLQRRHISKAKAHFYGGGVSLYEDSILL